MSETKEVEEQVVNPYRILHDYLKNYEPGELGTLLLAYGDNGECRCALGTTLTNEEALQVAKGRCHNGYDLARERLRATNDIVCDIYSTNDSGQFVGETGEERYKRMLRWSQKRAREFDKMLKSQKSS